MDNIFRKYSFVLVYIDDILVFSYTFQEHIKHLELIFEKLISHGLIIVSKKKLKLLNRIFRVRIRGWTNKITRTYSVKNK